MHGPCLRLLVRSGSLAGWRNTIKGSPSKALTISISLITVMLQFLKAVVLGT